MQLNAWQGAKRKIIKATDQRNEDAVVICEEREDFPSEPPIPGWRVVSVSGALMLPKGPRFAAWVPDAWLGPADGAHRPKVVEKEQSK